MNRKREDWFRKRAQQLFRDAGQLEVDDNAPVSMGSDAGAYVQVWVWVAEEEAEQTCQ
jgi:hypothetical protein